MVLVISDAKIRRGAKEPDRLRMPYGRRRLAQTLRPASNPVSHREQDNRRRASRSRFPPLESKYILITRRSRRPLRARDRSVFDALGVALAAAERQSVGPQPRILVLI